MVRITVGNETVSADTLREAHKLARKAEMLQQKEEQERQLSIDAAYGKAYEQIGRLACECEHATAYYFPRPGQSGITSDGEGHDILNLIGEGDGAAKVHIPTSPHNAPQIVDTPSGVSAFVWHWGEGPVEPVCYAVGICGNRASLVRVPANLALYVPRS